MKHRGDTIGKRIRARRLAMGLTQEELAHRMDGTPPANSVARFERDERAPSVDSLRALAIALKCSADHLLGLSD